MNDISLIARTRITFKYENGKQECPATDQKKSGFIRSRQGERNKNVAIIHLTGWHGYYVANITSYCLSMPILEPQLRARPPGANSLSSILNHASHLNIALQFKNPIGRVKWFETRCVSFHGFDE